MKQFNFCKKKNFKLLIFFTFVLILVYITLFNYIYLLEKTPSLLNNASSQFSFVTQDDVVELWFQINENTKFFSSEKDLLFTKWIFFDVTYSKNFITEITKFYKDTISLLHGGDKEDVIEKKFSSYQNFIKDKNLKKKFNLFDFDNIIRIYIINPSSSDEIEIIDFLITSNNIFEIKVDIATISDDDYEDVEKMLESYEFIIASGKKYATRDLVLSDDFNF